MAAGGARGRRGGGAGGLTLTALGLKWLGVAGGLAAAGLGLVLVGAAAGGVALLLARRLRFGRARVEFAGFPFFTGETLTVRLLWDGRIPADRVECTLRCVEERPVAAGVPASRRRHGPTYRACEVHRQAQTLCAAGVRREAGADGRGRRYLPVSFALPAGAPTTRLRREFATY